MSALSGRRIYLTVPYRAPNASTISARVEDMMMICKVYYDPVKSYVNLTTNSPEVMRRNTILAFLVAIAVVGVMFVVFLCATYKATVTRTDSLLEIFMAVKREEEVEKILTRLGSPAASNHDHTDVDKILSQ